MMNLEFHSESPSDDSRTSLHEAVFGSPIAGVWDTFDPLLHEHSSPDGMNIELTVPPFRRPHIYQSPPVVRHNVQLSDSPPSVSSNPLHHNGVLSTNLPLNQHDLLNRLPTLFHQYGPPNYTTNYTSTQPFDSSVSPTLDFTHLRSDYLNMITNNQDNNTFNGARSPAQASSSTLSPLTPLLGDDMAAQAVMNVLEGSPMFSIENEFKSYLTSPLDDSPWEDSMLTPPSFGAAGDMGVDILTSPALIDSIDQFGDMPLYGDAPLFDLTFDKLNAHNASQQALFQPDFEEASPHSEFSLDPVSLRSSPKTTPPVSKRGGSTKSNTRRKSNPTGTRKNVTPDSLVPVDAPIQPRNYVAPSATSRKELPAVFARKRKRSVLDDEEEKPVSVTLSSDAPPTPVELDAIEAKRKQNTLAARRSRKRKLEHQKELEGTIEDARLEKEMWRNRAIALEALLRSHGIEVPTELAAPR